MNTYFLGLTHLYHLVFVFLEMDPSNHSPPPNSSVASPTGGNNGLHIGHNNNNNPDSRLRMSPSNAAEAGQDLTSRPENVGYHNF